MAFDALALLGGNEYLVQVGTSFGKNGPHAVFFLFFLVVLGMSIWFMWAGISFHQAFFYDFWIYHLVQVGTSFGQTKTQGSLSKILSLSANA